MKKSLTMVSLVLLFSACQAPRPNHLGIKNVSGSTVLEKCPQKPNCINSHFDGDKEHFLDPLKYEGSKDQAKNLLKAVMKRSSNAKLVNESEDYLHYEFSSSIFKFIDDVEFNFTENGLIHFKSASRTGYSDLGVNKKRMNEISFRYYQKEI